MSNTFFFEVIPVPVTARWTDFVYVSLLRLSGCSFVLFVNIHTCDSFIKKSNSVGIFLLCEFAKIWRGSPANRKSPSTVLTTHGNTGHRMSIVTVMSEVG